MALTVVDGAMLNTANAQYTMFKNKLINGAFNIWQRGTSFTGNFTNLYGADRWAQGQFQTGPQSRQTVSTNIGFNYACRISSSSVATVAGGTRMCIGQMVESVNCYDLKDTPVTLSFWVRFSNATFTSSTASPYGDFAIGLWQYTTTTDANFSTSAADIVSTSLITNGSLPTTWTKYTLTTTTSVLLNNIAVRLGFANLGSTAADGTLWYEVTGAQIEKGSNATSFDYRPFTTELQLCQRYFQTWSPPPGRGVSNSTTAINRIGWPLLVEMRVAPTTTISGNIGWYDGTGTGTISSFTAVYGTSKIAEFDANTSGVTAAGRPIVLYVGGSTGSISSTAEL